MAGQGKRGWTFRIPGHEMQEGKGIPPREGRRMELAMTGKQREQN